MSELGQPGEGGVYSPGFDRARSRSPTSALYRDDRADRGPRTTQAATTNHAAEAARTSKRECRVYVGNLGYSITWTTLKDFMREAGEVKFCEILTLPNGSSKGCGIVEYSTPEEAQRAIQSLSDTPLEGRPVFVREDREEQVRYGAPPTPFLRGGGRGGFAGAGRGGFGAPVRGGHFGGPPPPTGGAAYGASAPSQLFVANLPYEASWQDLKDLFRSAGNVSRADINMGPDGRSRGTGIVAFHNSNDASNAIAMYNGYDFRGRILEVRLDRFAGPPAPDAFAGRGGYGRGGFGPPGAFGGRGGAYAGRGGFAGGYTEPYVPGGYGAAPAGPAYGVPRGPSAAPTQQIFVKNLPWSTSNDDLVELFQTIGTVEQAEILYEGGRSKGTGLVQFATAQDAETSIAKFNGYVYGGRPLDIEFNRRWHSFGSAQGTDENYRVSAAYAAPTNGVPAPQYGEYAPTPDPRTS